MPEPERLCAGCEERPGVHTNDDGIFCDQCWFSDEQREIAGLRAGISWARGMCTDGDPHERIDHFLGCVLAGKAQLPDGAVDDADRLAAALESALFALAVSENGCEPGEITQVLLDYRAKRRQSVVTPREVTARADVTRVEHLQQQMGDEG